MGEWIVLASNTRYLTKACLDSVATSLREAEINERVIGSILGHTPKTSTGIYGSVSIEAMRNAFNYLQTLWD